MFAKLIESDVSETTLGSGDCGLGYYPESGNCPIGRVPLWGTCVGRGIAPGA
ncbi:MAG: hypothetical protein HXS51_07290 [Theionarchaea archaeon]|nr:hypothetical protein [Theionarchaea archaeon]